MRNATLLLGLVLSSTALLGLAETAQAGQHWQPHYYIHYDRGAAWHNATLPWHGPYYHVAYGQPLALIVPPTATMQTNYSWGVARTRMTPTLPQFMRPIPPPGWGGMPLYATPAWPSDTAQFGVYYVRGPW